MIEQRVFFTFEQYFKINEILAVAVRKFHAKYDWNSVLTSSTGDWVLAGAKHIGYPEKSRSNEYIEAVRESVGDNP